MRETALTPVIYQGRSVGNGKVFSKAHHYRGKKRRRVGEEIQEPKASDARLPVGWGGGERPQNGQEKPARGATPPPLCRLLSRALGLIHFSCCHGTSFLSFSFQGVLFLFLAVSSFPFTCVGISGEGSAFWLNSLFSPDSLSVTHTHAPTRTGTGLRSHYHFINQYLQP